MLNAACLAQIVAQENANFNGVGGDMPGRAERQGPGGSNGLANFAIRVLVKHHIDGARSQTFAGGCGQFMGNDPQTAGATRAPAAHA